MIEARGAAVEAATETEDRESAEREWPDRFGDGIAASTTGLVAILLVAAAVVVIIEIIYRYWLKLPFLASTDIESFLFTWITFLALPRAIWLDRSPRMNIIRFKPGLVGDIVGNIQVGATLGYFGLMFWSYLKLEPAQAQTNIATIGLPNTIDGFAVLVGSALMATVLVIRHRRALLGVPAIGIAIGAAAVVVAVLYGSSPVLFGIIVLAALLLLNAPIAVALGLGGFVLVVGGDSLQASIPAQQLLQPMQNLAFLALPLFLLMGGLVAKTRLSNNLATLIRRLIGWLPGGTAIANVLTAAVFANISGSAIADTAATGEIYIPQLIDQGYPREEAAAVSAAAGVVGVVFPPAVAMILYASVAMVNVIQVFEAVIVPGLILLAVIGTISYFRGRVIVQARKGVREPFSVQALLRALPPAIPVLLIPIVLDGGILSGIFTPTESGAVAVAVVVVIMVAMRLATVQGIRNAVTQTVDSTATVMFIITAVSIIDYGFSVSGIGASITTLLGHVTGSRILLLLVINLVFMIVHEFVDAGPTILVLVPLILTSAVAAHVSLLQLGVVIAINSTIGAVLPPVGLGVYVAASIARVEARKVFAITARYALGSLVVLAVVVLVPSVSLWLPGS